MIFSFDLISDLHRETWPEFSWAGLPTAQYCVVAGDIARDRALVIDTLEQLSEVYRGVFYIDGNGEHKDHAEDLGQSYKELELLVGQIPNVVYLHNNVVVIDGVAILATNGWWSYDFDPAMDVDQSVRWVQEQDNISYSAANDINGVAYHDAVYMYNSVGTLQRQRDVKAIVMVTHTVPSNWLVSHDPDLTGTWRYNSMGNSHMDLVFEGDTEKKIKTWCFGHYHRPIDMFKDGIRYVSNPRGGGDTPYSQPIYYPKRITVEF